MNATDQIPPKKDTTWIWVVLVAILVCLCSVAVVGTGGLIYYFLSRGELPGGITIPGLVIPTETPMLSPLPQPALPSATTEPPVSGLIVIEAFDPVQDVDYPTLVDLVLNWEGQTKPGTMTWQANVTSQQPALVVMGWCAKTEAILTQNQEFISYSLTVDGRDIRISGNLYPYSFSEQDQACAGFAGTIHEWPLGEHTIINTMIISQPINDGWNDYPAGNYVDVFEITVEP